MEDMEPLPDGKGQVLTKTIGPPRARPRGSGRAAGGSTDARSGRRTGRRRVAPATRPTGGSEHA
jgi:hypothetical protein